MTKPQCPKLDQNSHTGRREGESNITPEELPTVHGVSPARSQHDSGLIRRLQGSPWRPGPYRGFQLDGAEVFE